MDIVVAAMERFEQADMNLSMETIVGSLVGAAKVSLIVLDSASLKTLIYQ